MKKPNGELEPTLLTIFGITGDLAKQKLLPALYDLEKSRSLPKHFYIIGVTRRQFTKSDLSKQLKNQLQKNQIKYDSRVVGRLIGRVHIARIEITKPAAYPE